LENISGYSYFFLTGVIFMNRIATIEFLIITVLLFFFSGSTVLAAKAMPEFSLTSAADDSIVSSKDFQGKVLLVTFFATWCPPCRQEIPEFIDLQKKLGSKGFSIVGISVDEGGSEVVKKLIEIEDINYPVLMADENVINGFGGISGVPTSFLVNRKGSVVKSYPGYAPRQIVEEDINELL
jgi:thiol-disulfide isomerase/thioredoxin